MPLLDELLSSMTLATVICESSAYLVRTHYSKDASKRQREFRVAFSPAIPAFSAVKNGKRCGVASGRDDSMTRSGDRCHSLLLPRQITQPDQERHQRIEHDQCLPEIEVKPVEPDSIPLPEIEQADDAHEVQRLDC